MRAISSFNLEAGTSTFWCLELIALRIRDSISATGSVNLMFCFSWSRPFVSAGCVLLAEEPVTTLFQRLRLIQHTGTTKTTWKHPEFPLAAPARGSRAGKGRTFAGKHVGVRKSGSGCACVKKTWV